MDLEIALLAPTRHDRAAFSCGEPSLDTYLKQQATQDMRRDLAACHVLAERGGASIIGYYALSATSVLLTELPAAVAKTSGRYERVPGVLLGRLAVDMRFQGQGMSDILLVDALKRALESSQTVGTKLVLVDALNEGVVGFYERRDFKRLQDDALRLYLSMSQVRTLFPSPPGAPGQPTP